MFNLVSSVKVSFNDVSDEKIKQMLSETYDSLSRICAEGLRVLESPHLIQLKSDLRLNVRVVELEFSELADQLEQTCVIVMTILNKLKNLKEKERLDFEEKIYAEEILRKAVIAKTIENSIDILDLVTNPDRQTELLIKAYHVGKNRNTTKPTS